MKNLIYPNILGKYQYCLFVYFLVVVKIDFDRYYIVRTDKGQPRPKNIFNKMWN